MPKKVADDCVYTLLVKNFVEIALSHTVPKINAFKHLHRNSIWPSKMAEKIIFGKQLHMSLHVPCGSKISSKSLYHLVGTEKVAEHVFVKCSKCTAFGVISNLLKVATSPITHLAIDLDLQKQQKYKGHKKVSQNNLPQ